MAQNAFRKTPSRKDSAEVLGTHAANPILGEQQRKQCEGTITIKSREERENVDNSEMYNQNQSKNHIHNQDR